MDKTPIIAFVRFKLSFAAMRLQITFPDAIMGVDTIVWGLDHAIDHPGGMWPSPEHIDYFELLEVSPILSSATPLEVSEYDDALEGEEDEFEYDESEPDTNDEGYYDYNYWPPLKQPRASSSIERALDIVGVNERPSFGRRILLVNYNQSLDERGIERARDKIRRRLFAFTPVWQGRTFEAYCFIDNRPPDSILERVLPVLDCDEVDDYLLAQPTNMTRMDDSGLSPLADWMSRGWREQSGRGTNTHDRKTGRS